MKIPSLVRKSNKPKHVSKKIKVKVIEGVACVVAARLYILFSIYIALYFPLL